ncbi:hypothetical protein SMC26_40410 [Actinomadura fulvescens]|uniref:PD-(D/E)XK endonuclease-like domain-containing protein n=1 Tax=Actinomadura fulvescens TaxID=46160 RepID=A0ABN3Q8W6_9ACTN
MTVAEGPFNQPGGGASPPEDPLRPVLLSGIRAADAGSARSRQAAIGPSEVGEPCDRRVAYRLLDWPTSNGGDPWFAIIGTAVHAWLADAFGHARHGGRWLVEQRVTVRPGLRGTADLYDTARPTVIDWKVVGKSSLDRYRAHGPSPRYRVQIHLYAAGMVNAGRRVDRVAIAFLPRSGFLDGAHLWSEPFDPAVVERALARLDAITELVCLLDPEQAPERWSVIPASPSSECRFCPFWRPGSTDLSKGCPGDTPAQIGRTAA